MENELKKLRNRLGLSQQALAKLSGVGRFKISSAERDFGQLSVADQTKIERVASQLTKKLGNANEQQQD